MMRKIDKAVAASLLLMGAGLSSCLSGGTEYTPQGGGVVEVVNSMGLTSFKDIAGVSVYPTSTSLASVENAYKFETENTKTAYILYNYLEENRQNNKVQDADLRYAVKLDGKVEMVSSKGDANDSVATAAICELTQLVVTDNEDDMFVMNDRFLLLGLKYFMAEYAHYFTVVYYPEEAAQSEELKLYLRHTGTTEKDGTFRTSLDYYNSGYPHAYMFTFDLQQILNDWRTKHPEAAQVDIVLEADVNLLNSKLTAGCEKKKYTVTYKFTD